MGFDQLGMFRGEVVEVFLEAEHAVETGQEFLGAGAPGAGGGAVAAVLGQAVGDHAGGQS